jgi:hypothetical protein
VTEGNAVVVEEQHGASHPRRNALNEPDEGVQRSVHARRDWIRRCADIRARCRVAAGGLARLDLRELIRRHLSSPVDVSRTVDRPHAEDKPRPSTGIPI